MGKGKGSRLFLHGRRKDDRNRFKLERLAAGSTRRAIVGYFACEKLAFAHESALIRAGAAELTNIAQGESIDPRDSAMAQARTMLAKVVPFERWAPPAWLKFPMMGFATARAVYDAWIAEVQQEAVSPTPNELWIGSDGHMTRQVWYA